jgi:hypothetical protein
MFHNCSYSLIYEKEIASKEAYENNFNYTTEINSYERTEEE